MNQDELSRYLCGPICNENDDPSEYWRNNKTRFPILTKVASDYLALQPTSKDVEGNFFKAIRTLPLYRRSQKAQKAFSIRNQMLVNSGYNLGVFE